MDIQRTTLQQTTQEKLEALSAAILIGAGAGEEEAKSVAHYLVLSDLVGHPSHGVLRVKQYVEQIGSGQIVCRVTPTIINDGPGFTALDGGLGFGQIGAALATLLACEKAKTQGIAIATLRNSAHVGRLGDWVEMAAAHGCISMHFVNTLAAPTVAPWGGRERRLSTNPLAWGMPVAGGDPIVVDLTTSVVAEGKVRLARTAGKEIPAGWIVDRDGVSSTDPNALYNGGALLPLGGLDAGHKGYALSLMVDLMAGALSGGGSSGPDRKINCNNFTVIAIDHARVGGGNGVSGDGSVGDDGPQTSIIDEAARFTAWIKAATPVDPARPVMLPGDVERAHRSRMLREGLVVNVGVITALKEAAVLAGLSPDIVTHTL